MQKFHQALQWCKLLINNLLRENQKIQLTVGTETFYPKIQFALNISRVKCESVYWSA